MLRWFLNTITIGRTRHTQLRWNFSQQKWTCIYVIRPFAHIHSCYGKLGIRISEWWQWWWWWINIDWRRSARNGHNSTENTKNTHLQLNSINIACWRTPLPLAPRAAPFVRYTRNYVSFFHSHTRNECEGRLWNERRNGGKLFIMRQRYYSYSGWLYGFSW